ncbi:amino acid permease [bacterium]|jgi:basic amino acid/polyamine antiporter, APA family|nr:amino acid permease [bacterium]MBT3903644.1 amino acid permease [bacterium]MBT4577690.1 amino acid permease [bacterium]MBT5345533.1 amino acid permease [bacterium]MBT6131324.1 amino acid permease [bacterium]
MATTQTRAKIGVMTATIIGMNAMIGAGIFAVPATLASSVGPAGLLTYAFVIMAVWFMALSISRVAQLYPEEGSFYTYSRQWGGHLVGVAAAGMYLIGLLIAMGLLAQVAGSYLHEVLPMISQSNLGLMALLALIGLNVAGVQMAELGQRILIITTVFPILATTVLCFTKADPTRLTPFLPKSMDSVLHATKSVIFGFFGFECAASLFNVVKNPKRNVPRALTSSIVLVGGLYLLFVTAIILSTPLSLFVSAKTTLSSVLTQVFPNFGWLVTWIRLAVLSAVIGTLHSMIWSSSALLISFVRKLRSAPMRKIARSKYFNPRTSVLAVGACIITSCLVLSSPDLFFSLTAIFLVTAYALSMMTLLFIPAEWKSGRNLITVGGLGMAGVILTFAVMGVVSALS